jgi:hypothetical protein
MINFSLRDFCWAIDLLDRHVGQCTAQAISQPGLALLEPHKAIVRGNFEFIAKQCVKLSLDKADSRLARISRILERHCTYDEIANEFKVLLEAIEDDIQTERFYHYRKDKGLLVLTISGDRAQTIAAFRSAEKDIQDAVDCYATDHETACVFHLMRVLEHGMKALALALNLTFDIQQWNTIIAQIEAEIRDIGLSWPASPRKADWLQFYSEAARHFFFLKDAWRNHVSHNRATYDETSAKEAMEHVRGFMNHLSTRLSE